MKGFVYLSQFHRGSQESLLKTSDFWISGHDETLFNFVTYTLATLESIRGFAWHMIYFYLYD